jgi:hypothetical protein
MSPLLDSNTSVPPAPARRGASWRSAARYVQQRLDVHGSFGGLKRLAPEAFAKRLLKRLTDPARARAIYPAINLPQLAKAAQQAQPSQARWEQGTAALALEHTVYASSNPYGTDQAHLSEGFDFFHLNDLPEPECIHGLNRCRWFISLARQYWTEQDPAYFNALLWHWDFYTRHVPDPDAKQIESLHAIGPENRQLPPYHSLNSFIRLTSWWHAFWLAIHAREMTPQIMVTLLAHCLKLLDYVHAHGVRRQEHNFTSMQMEGLYYWAMALPEFSGMETLAVMARNCQEFSLARALLPDGVQWEMSISYHCGCIGWYGGPALLGKRLGQPWSPAYLDLLQKMGDALDQLIEADGLVVPLSDSDSHTNWRKGLGLLTQLFPDQPYQHLATPDYDTLWLTAGQVHLDIKTRQPDAPFKLFPDSKLLIVRTGKPAPGGHNAGQDPPSSLLVFDNGPSNAGHAHRDQLSVYWRAGKHLALVDPGRWIYRDGDPDRLWVTSMRSHNCLWIAGSSKDEARSLPPPVADRLSPEDPRLGPIQITQDKQSRTLRIEANFAGYLADNQARVTRQLFFPLQADEHWLLIVDAFEGSKAWPWVNSWLTPGSTPIASRKDRWQAVLDPLTSLTSQGPLLHCLFAADHSIKVQTQPAFWTPEYAQKSPAQWTRHTGKAIKGVRAHLFVAHDPIAAADSPKISLRLSAKGHVTAEVGTRQIKTVIRAAR